MVLGGALWVGALFCLLSMISAFAAAYFDKVRGPSDCVTVFLLKYLKLCVSMRACRGLYIKY